MALIYKLGFFAVIIFSFIFASWYVAHGDITFSADIGRDFHLLNEINEKKLVLIGPRSSSGLFHGPLWSYINYPLFVAGHGNPIVVGWGWVFFVALFSASSFYIAKNLFNKKVAFAYTALVTLYAAFHARGLYNPHGAMFLIPVFFFFFIKYMESLKPVYLISLIVTVGLIIQFQLAIGIPLFALSAAALIYKQIKSKKYTHMLYFLLLGLFLANFALFDLRHDFLYSGKLFSFINPAEHGQVYNYLGQVQNRVSLMLMGPEILRRDPGYINFILIIVSALFIYFQVKDKKYKLIYYSFLYFYVGFFVLSFIDKGPILYFHLFTLFPLVILIFCSFLTGRFKKAFFILYLLVLFANIHTGFFDIQTSKEIIGKDAYSWKFLYNTSQKIFSNKGEFGYFVYSPDVVAYEAKYAMKYVAQNSNKKSYYFTKKPTTYLLIAPPPQNNPYMQDLWWTKNRLKITSSPSSTIHFPNGYKIERYQLSKEELNSGFDSGIDPGLHFR